MAERFVKDDFLVHIEFEEVKKKLVLQDPDDIELVQTLFEQAVRIARPKAICRTANVDGITGDKVTIGGTMFQSAVMAENLKDAHRVFAYVVTCGIEVDSLSQGQKDYFIALWLDMIKEIILVDIMTQFTDIVCNKYDIEKYATMNPGSGNIDVWPIAQQRPLFELIGDVQKDSGVILKDSLLMVPTKSVSGILFPSDSGYINCEVCTRENCVNRRAPYNPALSYNGSH